MVFMNWIFSLLVQANELEIAMTLPVQLRVCKRAAGLTEIVLVKQQVNPAGRAERRTAISLCWRDLSKAKSKYFASSEDTLT